MTEVFDDVIETSGALATEGQAADWLSRKQFWNWTADDQVQLETWLAQSPANEIAYWRLQGALERSERLKALRPPRPANNLRPILARAAAAVLAIGMLAGGYSFYALRPQGVAYATSVGGHETIVLADGSRIELNTDTAVRIAETAAGRQVWLERGEAYFQVNHDVSRPLVVKAGDRRITDLGTKFSIRRDADNLVVAVMEGQVTYDAPHIRSVLLTAGETMATSPGKVSISHKTQHDLANELGWRRGIVVFNGTRLEEAVNEINRYNSRKITIADPKLADVKLTATVSANDPQQFIRMTEYLLGLRRNEGTVRFRLSQ